MLHLFEKSDHHSNFLHDCFGPKQSENYNLIKFTRTLKIWFLRCQIFMRYWIGIRDIVWLWRWNIFIWILWYKILLLSWGSTVWTKSFSFLDLINYLDEGKWPFCPCVLGACFVSPLSATWINDGTHEVLLGTKTVSFFGMSGTMWTSVNDDFSVVHSRQLRPYFTSTRRQCILLKTTILSFLFHMRVTYIFLRNLGSSPIYFLSHIYSTFNPQILTPHVYISLINYHHSWISVVSTTPTTHDFFLS